MVSMQYTFLFWQGHRGSVHPIRIVS
uniref:Uncharacterized protein n=1 Tax=Anguilla anguilla TaxID=7936 RepID=A0A0E9XWB6_ANGAN